MTGWPEKSLLSEGPQAMKDQTTSLANLGALPSGDRALLKGLIVAALAALFVGLLFGVSTALVRAGVIELYPKSGYVLMTLHGVTVFFYWLYFAQSALLLAFSSVYTPGAGRIALVPAAWLGFVLMLAGFAANVAGTVLGEPLLYDGSPDVVGDDKMAAGVFYVGYLLLAVGLFLVASASIATALRPKFLGTTHVWSSTTFGTVAWAGLVMVSAVAALNTFVPAALWAFDWAAMPAQHSSGWHILFHNLHYLPLMGTVLIWYVLVREMTGVGTIFGDRFSKFIFSLYLVFVPPTSLYHMFLDPGLSDTVRVIGSILSLFISVPTVAVFLVIVASLEAQARSRGARGLFGWLRRLPWRDPSLSAVGMAVVNLAIGGTFAFVLVQEQFAPLLSDTFFVPGYFHFLTVGTVTLTLLAALCRIIPALTQRQLLATPLLARLPYAVTAGLLLFGTAGIAAGLSGMPRRVLDAGYDGVSPKLWTLLSGIVGAGAAIMATTLVIYVCLLAGSLLTWRDRPEQGRFESPVSVPQINGTIGKAAWTGPISVVVLIAGMYAITLIAFKVLRTLPLVAMGSGH